MSHGESIIKACKQQIAMSPPNLHLYSYSSVFKTTSFLSLPSATQHLVQMLVKSNPVSHREGETRSYGAPQPGVISGPITDAPF